jgi:hypothetical protein
LGLDPLSLSGRGSQAGGGFIDLGNMKKAANSCLFVVDRRVKL